MESLVEGGKERGDLLDHSCLLEREKGRPWGLDWIKTMKLVKMRIENCKPAKYFSRGLIWQKKNLGQHFMIPIGLLKKHTGTMDLLSYTFHFLLNDNLKLQSHSFSLQCIQ